MHSLEELEKQQVGLRLPKFLIKEIDELTKEYSLNRSEIITESIREFIINQKNEKIYASLDNSCKELNRILEKGDDGELGTLGDFIDELDNKTS